VSSAGSTPSERAWDEAVGLLRRAEDVTLFAHVNPDADSLGSAVALGLALRSVGVGARVSFGGGGHDGEIHVPETLRFLPGLDLVVAPAEVPAAPDVVVVLDTAHQDRLGSLADRVEKAGAVIVVDHHRTVTGLGTHRLVDVSAPATGVLVLRLVDALGAELTADIAVALYAAVASDTGSFRYAGTTPATHHLAARLLAAGVRQDQVSAHLWDSVPLGYLHVLAGALAGVRLEAGAVGGRGLVWTTVSAADRRAHGLRFEAVEGVIDVVRKAREAEVAAVLREDDAGRWLVSLRSRGSVDVSTVARTLGGGGHMFAAGFTAPGGPEAAVAAVREALAAQPRG
jgi:bifunctional oligoribonuclease and PAP phosphatase NrnA